MTDIPYNLPGLDVPVQNITTTSLSPISLTMYSVNSERLFFGHLCFDDYRNLLPAYIRVSFRAFIDNLDPHCCDDGDIFERGIR